MAPHLRSIIETRGAFGLSHTRVPTESRPGREFPVLVSGDLQLTSAFRRCFDCWVMGRSKRSFQRYVVPWNISVRNLTCSPGWKHNPVSFDSVFNHSSTTFSFGSPDILPIFAPPPPNGKNEDDPLNEERNILMWMYDADAEDFTSGSPSSRRSRIAADCT
jgi:phosphatidylinositol glycan class N